jgi:hypothetical protein
LRPCSIFPLKVHSDICPKEEIDRRIERSKR